MKKFSVLLLAILAAATLVLTSCSAKTVTVRVLDKDGNAVCEETVEVGAENPNSIKGKNFYGCSKYPQCDFVSSLRPAKEKCPKCGSYMVEARWGKLCSNKECAYKMTPARNKKES